MSRGKILVVEDEPEIAEAFQVNLEGAGYEVLVANDGMQALRLFDEEHPDLATIDLILPSISGFRLLELMKRPNPPGPVPVIIVTALSFQEGVEIALAGADDFVTKPLDPEELVRKVNYLMERRAEKNKLAGELGSSRI